MGPIALECKQIHTIHSPAAPVLAPGTMRTYQRAFALFAKWCDKRGKPALDANPDTIADYLQDMADRRIRAATIRVALAAIADAQRHSGRRSAAMHHNVRHVLIRLVQAESRPQVSAKPLTDGDLAEIRRTACTPRLLSGRTPREESLSAARARGLIDMAIISVMRPAFLRRSEAAALRWDDVMPQPDGSGRLYIPNADEQEKFAYLGEDAVTDLLAIRPDGPTNGGDPVFGMSPGHIGKRVRGAAIAAGLGDGYTSDSCRFGMAEDLNQAFPWRTPGHQERYQSIEAAGRGLVAQYYSLTRERVAIQR